MQEGWHKVNDATTPEYWNKFFLDCICYLGNQIPSIIIGKQMSKTISCHDISNFQIVNANFCGENANEGANECYNVVARN